MKVRFFFTLSFVWGTVAFCNSPKTGADIIEAYLEAQKADSELAFFKIQHSMPNEAPTERRFLVITDTPEGGKRSTLMTIVRPLADKGVAILLKSQGKEERPSVHLYLPAIGVPRELVGGGPSASFLGSEFSYNDLMDELTSDHQYRRLEDGRVADYDCFVVEASPSNQKVAAFSKRHLFLSKADSLLRKVMFFENGDRLVKTLTTEGYGAESILGESRRPQTAVMINHDTQAKSVITLFESQLNRSFDTTLFEPEMLPNLTNEVIAGLLNHLETPLPVEGPEDSFE